MKTTTLSSLFAGCLLSAILSATAATPQTWADFKYALAAAEDGATVYVENDLVWDSVLPAVNKRVTIRSRGDTRFVITRKANSGIRLLYQEHGSCANADITFEHVIVDGSCNTGATYGDPLFIEEGRLTLGAGCTIRNFAPRTGGIVVDWDGVLTMEDGSEITGFEGQASKDGFGMVVRVGNAHKKPAEGRVYAGRFVMNGGTIHGNVDNCATNDLNYGGIVYIYTGDMYFNGGLITSNRSVNACGGLMVYAGNLHVQGDGSIIDNEGGIANDLAYREGGIYVDGFYTGRMTFYQKNAESLKMWQQAKGWYINTEKFPEWADYGTGSNQSLNVSCQGRPNLVVAPYNRSYTYHYWCERVANLDDGRTFCVNAGTMTDAAAFDVLEKAISAVTNGGTVAVARDVKVNGSLKWLPGNKNYTLTSYGDERHVVSRATLTGNPYALLILNSAAVRVENLILDGNAASDTNHRCDSPIVSFNKSDSRFTLGPGGVIRNAWTQSAPSVANLQVAGSGFTMEEGSLIENCGALGAGGYGTVARVGANGAYGGDDKAAFFDMKGGAITRCESRATNSGQGYGGVIYLYNGVFRMSGGAITNNVDGDYGCAGVFAYVGNVYLSGDARIADNTGAYPGVRVRPVTDPTVAGSGLDTRVTVSGDFRGHLQLASGSQVEDTVAGVTVAPGADGTPFSGAWNLEPSRTTSEVPLVGTLEDGAVVWRPAIGGIDGTSAATDADLRAIWSQKGALQPASDGTGARVLSGRAKELDWSLDVVLDDPLAWRSSPLLPLTLVRADEGTLSGAMTFSFPDCRGGAFEALSSPSGDSWLMRFVRNGALLIVR